MLKPFFKDVKTPFFISLLPNHAIDDEAAKRCAAKRRRAGEKPKDDPSTPDVDESKNIHSVSQLSYDYHTERFGAMVDKAEAHGDYVTNEDDLQIPALQTYVGEMQTANKTVAETEIAAENTQNARDEFLYNPADGIIALANKVKTYVKSINGAEDFYRQLTALRIKKP